MYVLKHILLQILKSNGYMKKNLIILYGVSILKYNKNFIINY